MIALLVQSLLCSYTALLFMLYFPYENWISKNNGLSTHAAVWLQNESSNALDQLQTPKGLGNSLSD